METEIRKERRAIVFQVHEVEPATERLEEIPAWQCLGALAEGKVEACGDYRGMVVTDANYHALMAATHLAFSGHRPLVLTPDVVWITIAQGLAQHVAKHAEKLRSRFVSHEGREEITIQRPDFRKGDPNNAWDQVFHEFTGEIAARTGGRHDYLLCDFTTTGPLEDLASRIVMMDVFQPFYEYKVYCICGIPWIRMEGAPEDWSRLRDKLDNFKDLDLDWWLESLRPICDQFARAARGDVDAKHWRNIYKLEDAYGEEIINGWMGRLYPYVKNFVTGAFDVPNPIFETPFEDTGTPDETEWEFRTGLTASMLPSGLSSVPFKMTFPEGTYDMQFLGGLAGVRQMEDGALRPLAGWAVRDAEAADLMLVALGKLGESHAPAPAETMAAKMHEIDFGGFPGILNRLYSFYGSLEFRDDAGGMLRILSVDELLPHTIPPGVGPEVGHRPFGFMFARGESESRGAYFLTTEYIGNGYGVFLHRDGTETFIAPDLQGFLEDLEAGLQRGRFFFFEPGFIGPDREEYVDRGDYYDELRADLAEEDGRQASLSEPVPDALRDYSGLDGSLSPEEIDELLNGDGDESSDE